VEVLPCALTTVAGIVRSNIAGTSNPGDALPLRHVRRAARSGLKESSGPTRLLRRLAVDGRPAIASKGSQQVAWEPPGWPGKESLPISFGHGYDPIPLTVCNRPLL
jgi:hypothetical protein